MTPVPNAPLADAAPVAAEPTQMENAAASSENPASVTAADDAIVGDTSPLPAAEFTVSPDFRLLSFAQGATAPFHSAPQIGISVWRLVSEPVRRALYSAYKRLLSSSESVVVETEMSGASRLRFTCFRRGEDIVTTWQPIRQLGQVSTRPTVAMNGTTPLSPIQLPAPNPPTKPASAPPDELLALHAPPSPMALLPSEPMRPESLAAASQPLAAAQIGDDLFQFTPDIICLLSEDGRILGINPAGQAALQFDATQVPGLPFVSLVATEDYALVRRLWNTLDVSPQSLMCRCHGIGGDVRWVQWHLVARPTADASAPQSDMRVYAVGRDVTELHSREETLRWHYHHDTLTGLPNRALLQDRLQQAIVSAQRHKHQVAVLFLDLDRFKRINDSLGHAAGDHLLREVASRLQTGLREEDTVARLAGDEFVIVLPHTQDFTDALKVAEKVLERIGKPLLLSDQELFITASIGISMYPQDGETDDLLMKAADTAMYRAKAGGPGRFSVADASVDAGLSVGRLAKQPLERLRLENKLSQAIERDELFLHYQPQISMVTGRIVGAEALMRWTPGDMGAIPPSTFIPLAEETGLIVRMGAWAMHQAIVQAGQWRRDGNPVRVAVNLSAAQLSDKRFPDMLETYLNEWQIPSSLLNLELTERTFIHAEPATLDVLSRLQALGVGLSVDDFGTGYGTFSYLRKFPIDGLKVDHSFIAQVDTNPADEAVVRSIIDLAHTLNLNVIAEGVETTGQRDKLRELGCDTMQGYLFSRAVAADDFGPLLVPSGKL